MSHHEVLLRRLQEEPQEDHVFFDGEHGQPNGGVSELRIQDGRVEGPVPDDGSKPGGHDQHVHSRGLEQLSLGVKQPGYLGYPAGVQVAVTFTGLLLLQQQPLQNHAIFTLAQRQALPLALQVVGLKAALRLFCLSSGDQVEHVAAVTATAVNRLGAEQDAGGALASQPCPDEIGTTGITTPFTAAPVT